MTNKVPIPLSAINIFENKGIVAFYQVRECLSVYSSSGGVSSRREVGLQICNLLENFLSYNFSKEEVEYLDGLLAALKKSNKKTSKKSVKKDQTEEFMERFDSFMGLRDSNIQVSAKKSSKAKKGIFENLKILSSVGVSLLGIKGDIDLVTLQKLYRKSAFTHHPDRGGTTENMQIINQAYSLFHDAILSYRPSISVDQMEVFYPKSLGELNFSIHVTLASIYGDAFAGDFAHHHMLKADHLMSLLPDQSLGHFFNGMSDFMRVIWNPTRALSRLQMHKELKEVAFISSRFIDLYVDHYIPTDDAPFAPKREWMPTTKDFIKERDVKLVIHHMAQASNAYRLGKIDEKRYSALKKKFDFRDDVVNEAIKSIREFYKENGFIFNLTSADYSTPEVRPAVVKPLFWFVKRYEHLDDDQKWEYLQIFKEGNISTKIENYLKVRTQDILLGLIYRFDEIDIKHIKKEILFFLKIDMNTKDYSLLEEFINFIASEKHSERIKRLKMLAQIDDDQPWVGYTTAAIFSFDIMDEEEPEEHKMPITVSSSYIEFAMSPIASIEKFSRTGVVNTDYKKSWNKDLESISKLEKSPKGKVWHHVWLKSRTKKPEKVIAALEPYLLEALKLGKTLHPKNTGQIQIGYKVDRLTAAYVRIKNWDKAVYWIDLFFALPIHYRERSSRGEIETLQKRLIRSRKEIEKVKKIPKLLAQRLVK